MEHQGLRNWEGLLDPLDHTLRAEILRYGNFVDAAYTSSEFDPKSKLFRGYKVTKLLRATSGIKLPRWVEKAPTRVATQSSDIGYVAVCDDKEEIKRLGRRDVVVAYRGTTTCLEWLENLRTNLTHLPGMGLEPEGPGGLPMVECGFLSLYTSAGVASSSLQQMVRQEIGRILRAYGGEPLSLTITGHSLGAALATLTAYDVKAALGFGGGEDDGTRMPMVTVMSFGGPRVGNRRFREELERQGTKVLRIVNSEDVITKVPGFVFDDVAKGDDVHVAGVPMWIQKRVEDAQWGYAEVGKELRLCSRDSPYLSGINVATCHDLKTYLHLVDGFVSSTCPFQATAKRFLRR